jgi:hypothetical protein
MDICKQSRGEIMNLDSCKYSPLAAIKRLRKASYEDLKQMVKKDKDIQLELNKAHFKGTVPRPNRHSCFPKSYP